MTIDDKSRDEKLLYDINREAAKAWSFLSDKVDKYDYLTVEQMLLSNQRKLIEQTKFTYWPPDKALEKQTKQIMEHEKPQFKSTVEKESLTFSK